MATPHADPSRDPSDDDSLVGMARQVLDKFLQGVDDMLPAQVISYDRATNRATVAPLIKLLTTDGRLINRAQIASVPVLRVGGGGVVLSFALQPGNYGWIKANDRDISLFLRSYKASGPNTLRKHSFSDALFIPDVMQGVTVAGEDASSCVLQTLDGSSRVSVGAAGVKLTAGGSSVAITSGGVSIVGPLVINGQPYVNHTHTGVTSGGNNTGGVA